MPTYYSEDHADRKSEATVDATPVENDVSAQWAEAKVVEAPAKAPAKKAAAKVTTKKK
ncbi:MAG TPA: hypothetical protein VFM86_15255 [Pedococcus sp.]|jgi:hypothetical protein|nr:hypothetical protein [Pedococcus sp.]